MPRPGKIKEQDKTLRVKRRRGEKANVLETPHKAEVLRPGV
jgi:hypothetical protein